MARLDHGFERGLSRVTADYTLLPNGTVRVLNRGFLADKNKWKESKGKARFAGRTGRGAESFLLRAVLRILRNL